MLLCAHFSRTLNGKGARYEKKIKSARRNASPDSVHDARVSMRRLLSILDILEAVFPSRALSACRRELKEQLERFSALRDVQVQILSVKEMLPAYPELNPFYGSLLHEEQKAMKQIRKSLAQNKSGSIKTAQESLKNKLSVFASDGSADTAVRCLVLGAAAGAFHRVLRLRARVDPSNTETVHRMRVAFKHFRYMRETLHPHVVRLSPLQAKTLHDFQTLLGDLQDVEVLMDNFSSFLRKQKLPDDTFLPVHMAFLKKRTALLEMVLCRLHELAAYGEPVMKQYEKAREESVKTPHTAKGKS